MEKLDLNTLYKNFVKFSRRSECGCVFFSQFFFSILIFLFHLPVFYITSTQNVYNETSNSCLNFCEKFLDFENFLTNFFRRIMWVFWNFCVDWKTVFGRTWFLEFFLVVAFFHSSLHSKWQVCFGFFFKSWWGKFHKISHHRVLRFKDLF